MAGEKLDMVFDRKLVFERLNTLRLGYCITVSAINENESLNLLFQKLPVNKKKIKNKK